MATTQQIIPGDCIEGMRTLPDASVHCCVTSPPYWGLRDYGHDGQIGLEETPEAYVARMVEVFREVRRVLRDDGTCWVNLGDSLRSGGLGRNDADRNIGGRGGNKLGSGNPGRQGRLEINSGLKPKDLVGIPWRVAFALQADGWWLRQDIIWHKPNPMPESVTDRCTKAHEYVFLLTKSERYFYDAEAVSEAATKPPGSNGNFGNKDAASRMVGKITGNMRPGVEYLTKPTPQPPLRLDDLDEALQRRTLRGDAARSGRAVHQGGLPRAVLPGVRGDMSGNARRRERCSVPAGVKTIAATVIRISAAAT
jgi:hypothetical protein